VIFMDRQWCATLHAAQSFQAANKAASERKSRERKQPQLGGTLSQQEAEALIAAREAVVQAEAERREERVQAGGSGGDIRLCGRCGEAGHNKGTCKKDIVDGVD
jgi:hypothetical protein